MDHIMRLQGRAEAVQRLRFGAAAAVNHKGTSLFIFKFQLICFFHKLCKNSFIQIFLHLYQIISDRKLLGA